MKEIQPVNQNVLLELPAEHSESTTQSGIIIPSTVAQKRNYGKITAISNIDNAEVSLNETVIFNELNAKEVAFEGKIFTMIQYSDILAKVVETEEI